MTRISISACLFSLISVFLSSKSCTYIQISEMSCIVIVNKYNCSFLCLDSCLGRSLKNLYLFLFC